MRNGGKDTCRGHIAIYLNRYSSVLLYAGLEGDRPVPCLLPSSLESSDSWDRGLEISPLFDHLLAVSGLAATRNDKHGNKRRQPLLQGHVPVVL